LPDAGQIADRFFSPREIAILQALSASQRQKAFFDCWTRKEAYLKVRFPSDSTLPDTFDGLLAKDADALHHIHACMGCPLYVDEKLVGALTADALDPHAFDHLEQDFLKAVGAIAGAQMQTANLIGLWSTALSIKG
jgi:anaerobic nitric oxide reductase transcription regulator